MIHGGRVLAVFPNKKTYRVLLDDGRVVDSANIESGMDFTVLRNDRVATCLLNGVGWKILGRFREPATKEEEEEQQKTTAQRIAEEQAWLNGIISGANLDMQTDYLEADEDPLLEGEVSMKGLVNESSVSVFNDGSILSRISDALMFLLSSVKSVAVLSAKRFILRLIPGVKVDIGLQEKGETQNPDITNKPKVKMFATLASDPDKPKDVDFLLEAGDIDKNVEQYGKSLKTVGQQLARGLRFFLEKFAITEVDNDKGEMRLTYLQDPTKSVSPLAGPFQVRMNEDEVVLSWGEQFISLTKDGLMIKAKRIGLAGPVDMWNPIMVEAFDQQLGYSVALAPDPVTFEWYDNDKDPLKSGIRVARSVYFGKDNQNDPRPAITEEFIEKRYKEDLQMFWDHNHQAGPIATSSPLNSSAAQAAFKAGTVDKVKEKWLSLLKISDG